MAEDSGDSDHWARAVESFTGYSMPSRDGMFKDLTALEPNGNAPLISVAIEDRKFMEMTDSAYQLFSGPDVDGHDFVLHFYLPKDENPDDVDLDDLSDDEIGKRFYPQLRKVLIDFVGPNGGKLDLNDMHPFSWYDGDGSSLDGMEHPLGQYVQGSGNALYNLGYRQIVHQTSKGFSSNGVTIDGADAMDFESFTRVAQAYDRVGKFFVDHAETLKQWKESLGDDQAAWKGKAAEVFSDLIDGLHKNYAGFADQMHPSGFNATHESMWDYYASSSKQGDAILGAGNAVFAAVRDLYQAYSDWKSGEKVDWAPLNGEGGDVEYLPGLGSPYGILYSMLESLQTWAYNHNARFAVQATKKGTESTWYSGNTTGAGSWHDHDTVVNFYTLRPEAEVTIPGLGNLNDITTWAGLGTKAVDSWNKGVEDYLIPAADTALSSVNNAFIDARRVIEDVLEPEVTNYFGGSGGAGGDGGDGDDVQDIIDDANAAIDDANAKAQAAIDKANKAAQDAIDAANKAADDAIAEANAAVDDANAKAKAAIDEANNEANEAIDEANKDAKAAIDEANAQLEDGNAEADAAADKANSDAQAAIDEANARADEAIKNANDDAKSVIDDANSQVDQNNGPGGPGDGPTGDMTPVTSFAPPFVRSEGPADATRERTNPDGSVTTTYPDGTKVTTQPDGSMTITAPDGSVQSIGPDGTITTNPDGSTVISGPSGEITTNPDGSTTVTGPSGQITRNPDGSTSVQGPGGRTTTSSDGTITVTGPDGTTTVTEPDGSSTVTAPDGTVQVTAPDGQISTTYPDGTTSVTAPDGTTTVTAPEGSSVVTGPDGSTTVTGPDGTVHVTSPDGEVITTSPDGTTVHSPPGDSGAFDTPERPPIHIDYPDGSPADVGPANPPLSDPGSHSSSSLGDSSYGNSSYGGSSFGGDGGSDGYAFDDAAASAANLGGYGGGAADNPFVAGDQLSGAAGASALGAANSPPGGGSPMMPPMGGMRGGGGEAPTERERSSPGPRISRAAMRRGSMAAQAAARRGTPAGEEELEEDVITTRSGAPFVPAVPPPTRDARNTQSGDRERTAWTADEEDVWGTDEGTTPAVIGR